MAGWEGEKLGIFLWKHSSACKRRELSIRLLLRIALTKALLFSKLFILTYYYTCRMRIYTNFLPALIFRRIAQLFTTLRNIEISIRQSRYFLSKIKIWSTPSIYHCIIDVYVDGIRQHIFWFSSLCTKTGLTIESLWDWGLWVISLFDNLSF